MERSGCILHIAGNVEIDSEIFIYDVHYARMRPFQRIRTSAARDWAAFHFSNGKKSEHFLAVANEYSLDAGKDKSFTITHVIPGKTSLLTHLWFQVAGKTTT